MPKLSETYIYCTVCKTQLDNIGPSKSCPNCGKRYYFNALPNVSAVITNERGELLLTKRSQEPFKGWWDMPGGFVNEGETLERATIRETEEEIGVQPASLTYLGSVPATYEVDHVSYNLVLILFSAHLSSRSAIKLGAEASAYAFFAKKDIPFDDIAFEAQRAFLKSYFKV